MNVSTAPGAQSALEPGGNSYVAVILKGYPRLSETFIAQEIKALEDLGLELKLFSLRQPTDHTIHPIHSEIHAPVSYLPEYVYRQIPRVLRGLWHSIRYCSFSKAVRAFLTDVRRDPTPNRIRRFAQACVLARELPPGCLGLYAHFMHTPGSVARYAAMLVNVPFALSAHAKDIWTIPEWEKREKLDGCTFTVTCTAVNHAHLELLARDPGKVHRLYHGLDLARFPDPKIATNITYKSRHNGSDGQPVSLLSVGRAVPKKGYDMLLDALARLPKGLKWRFRHIGQGPALESLRHQAVKLGIDDSIEWLGPLPQQEVLEAYRAADLFVLASTVAEDGDRDGLPNVLMEAQSQRLCCIATRVSGIPEIIIDEKTGFLVDDGDDHAMALAIERLARNPILRHITADTALHRLEDKFSMDRQIRTLRDLLVRL
ncbi:MAG: colanic acid biosynthesis glycosyltransferase WcaL [marine bacterium B5-7]|nr:MAG: colanic acid biosynthesis glycosyltransferase WcaL [marine bacterium B5-7]